MSLLFDPLLSNARLLTWAKQHLQLVTLSCPYDTLNDSLAQNLLGKAFALKLRGYQRVYPYGTLPLDSYDFVATHLLVCEREGLELQPVMGFKTVTLERCRLHQLPFPALTVLRSSGAEKHAQALEATLKVYEDLGHRVSYGSSWTLDPKYSQTQDLKFLFKGMMAAILFHHEKEISSDLRITCGVVKVKTDQFFEKLGYSRFTLLGEHLPPFKQSSLVGEEAVLLTSEIFSAQAEQLALRYQSIWDERLKIESIAAQLKKAA